MKWKLDILEPIAKYSKMSFEFDDYEELMGVLLALANSCTDRVAFEVSMKEGEEA